MKVFIADDSAQIRERLKEMLSELPRLKVIGEAGDAPEAMRALHVLEPDVVILDIRMPKGSGIEVLKSIRQNESHPTVIMLTNYPYHQYRTKSMELGADYFFNKSTDFERIVEVCEQLAKNFQMTKKNEK